MDEADELVRAREEAEDETPTPELGVTILGCAVAEEVARVAASELLWLGVVAFELELDDGFGV